MNDAIINSSAGRVAPGGKLGVEYHPPHEATRGQSASAAAGAARSARAAAEIDRPAVEPYRRSVSQAVEPEDESAVRLRIWGPDRQFNGQAWGVGSRVDWLTVAFKVTVSAAELGRLEGRLGEEGRVAVELAGMQFELGRLRSGGKLIARNADMAVTIDLEGVAGWTVKIECPGAAMMVTPIATAVERARAVARALGIVHGERVRRLDLCVDVAGWDVRDVDAKAWIKAPRARVERADVARSLEKSESPELRQYRRNAQVTGYTICPGNPLSAVVYDKREELQAREHKREVEESRWLELGWDGKSPVTRLEFRLRADALHELGARDGLDAFQAKLDGIWAYCTHDWLRLVRRQGTENGQLKRLSRCELDDAWRVVQKVVFVHKCDAVKRRRIRGGATASHALGAIVSLLAAAGMSPAPLEVVNEDGEVLDEEHAVAALGGEAEARTVLRERLQLHAALAGDVIEDTLVKQFGVRRAAVFMLVREGAARARFWSAAPADPAMKVAA